MNPVKAPSTALIQQKRSVRDLITADKTKLEIAKVLPKHLTPERMTRVALTATMKNPALLNCTPESLMNALLVCSQAGLEPDGRLAHLIPFGNSVQVIFDYKGLVTLALRNGAQSVFADKVCEMDDFDASVVNGKKVLTHRVNWKHERGNPVCYYAVCQRQDEIDWEVMSLEEVDEIRKRSKAADSGPWVTDYDEMAKKTVLRRMSKRWDLLPEIRDVIYADDDNPQLDKASFAKPVFSSKSAQIEVPPAPVAPAPSPEPEEQTKPESGNDSAQQTPTPESAPKHIHQSQQSPKEENVLAVLRGLLRNSHIREGKLLDFLQRTGATGGDVATLEELALQYPDVVSLCCDEWEEMEGRIDSNLRNTQ